MPKAVSYLLACLQTVMGLDFPPEAVLALERRTEGRVAGLQTGSAFSARNT